MAPHVERRRCLVLTMICVAQLMAVVNIAVMNSTRPPALRVRCTSPRRTGSRRSPLTFWGSAA